MSFDAATYNWAACAIELLVSDVNESKRFYCNVLSFECMYERPGFAYLDYHGSQVMFNERNGNWETGPMEKPYGRGVNLQITTPDLDTVLTALATAEWPLYDGPYERTRVLGSGHGDFRELLIQDPDGYLLRFSQVMGYRR